jgi:hypothetical protein
VSADWRLLRRITTLLAAGRGITDADIPDRPGVTATEARQVARILYRRRLAGFCAGYVAAAPSRGERRRAA